MAFFLETLLGGLMAGMLYSLVALGFVLIYKASGVFNFAQGAMVLFAALAMARFAEWIPQWTGIESRTLANIGAFIIAAFIMFLMAWLIERLVLRHLVNQEGANVGQGAALDACPLRNPFGKPGHGQCREQHHRTLRKVEDTRRLVNQHKAQCHQRIQHAGHQATEQCF